MKPQLFEKSPKQTAVELIRLALADELRETPTLTALAENLDAIAQFHHIPTETVVAWIHAPAAGKRWTAAEFRRWCEHVEEERRRAAAEAEQRLPSNYPE